MLGRAATAAHRRQVGGHLLVAGDRVTELSTSRKEDGTTPADPFDVGAGRDDLTNAALAGFVMDETTANYQAANPSTGGDVKRLNLPSMYDSNCEGTCSWTRTPGMVAGRDNRVRLGRTSVSMPVPSPVVK